MTKHESSISKVNINALYIGSHWELYSDKFEISDSVYTDVCVRGTGSESKSDDEFFTTSEIENTHFMVVSGDMENGKSVQSILDFAKKFKSFNKVGVLIAVMTDSYINGGNYNILEDSFDHIIFIEDNNFLSSPVKLINSVFQEGFMPVEFFEVYDLFKNYKYSILSMAGCQEARDINDFLDFWPDAIKKYCNTIKFNVQGMLVNLAIGDEDGDLGMAEIVFSALEKTIDHKERDFLPTGQFVAQDVSFEVSVLTMSNG